MIKRTITTAVAGMLLAAGLHAATITPDVRTGTLPNGFTYYIQHNDKPTGTADYFFAQKVGSVNEEESQRGLAHFLEHMCFNGTEHFPGNSLIAYLESIGVKFGAHLNAYTSTDETVYNICKAPTARPSTVDSCLMILRDWSCALLLDSADIDAERGIIVNEWRQRNTASNRMLEKAFPRLYGDSPYGHRLPIGLMSVVENFNPETLRRFYNKWYIPGNQAVIVVGDINVEEVEKNIRNMFGSLPAMRDASSELVSLPVVPVSDSLVCVVESDPEHGSEMLQLYFRMPPMPRSAEGEIRRKVLGDMASGMLAERFEALEASAECPHNSLGIGEVKYLMSRGEQAFTMRGMVKAGRENDALEAWYGELMRAIQHGFSEAELEKARLGVKSTVDERRRRLASADNTYNARQAVRHFLDGGDIIDGEEYLNRMEGIAKNITSADVVAYLESAVGAAPRGAVIYLTRPQAGKSDAEVEAGLCTVFSKVGNASYAPYVPQERSESLMSVLPESGHIVTTDSISMFGAKLYTLSNGIRVVTRRSDSKKDQIFIRAYSPGGLSMVYDERDVPTLRVVNELMAVMKHGGLTANAMQRILDSHNVKVSASVGNTEEGIEASTNRAGLETALQAMYLRATAFEADSVSFANFIDAQRSSINNRRLNPVQIMGDSIHYTIYNRHPLAARQTLDDVDSVDMSKAIGIYADRFGDMSDFTFMVVGDFDTDSLECLITRYVASLPAAGRVDTPRDFGYKYTPYDFDSRFIRTMANPQAIVYSFYSGAAEYSLDRLLEATTFGQLMRSRLLADLREDKAWTYSIKTHCAINPGVSPDSGPQVMMPSYIKVTPGREFETLDVVNATVASLANEDGISEDELAGIRSFLVKNHEEAVRDNAYWLKVLKAWLRDGVDLENGYEEAVGRLTPESVSRFGHDCLLPAHRAALVMSAEASE